MTDLQTMLGVAGDALLLAVTILNLISFAVIVLVPGYNPYKSHLIKWHAGLVSKLHKTPFLVNTALLLMLCLAVYYVYLYVSLVSALTPGESQEVVLTRALVSSFTFVVSMMFQKLSSFEIHFGPDRMVQLETELDQIDTIVNFTPPPKSLCKTLLAPYNAVLQREVVGLENISKDVPHFFVMNHSLLGFEMGPFVDMLYQEKDVYLRGLADNFHFTVSPHAEFMRSLGAVRGTRDNVDVLMKSKQNLLVYPGGANEVLKHSSVPKYSLLWKERLGFARMAIKHGYPIMPCCAVGTEDFLDIMADIPTPRKGLTIPVLKPINPGKLQKVYFWFGESIPTKQYNGDYNNDAFAREVRDKAKAAVEHGIQLMLERQAKDPQRYLMHHYATKIQQAKDDAWNAFSQSFPKSVSVKEGDDVSAATEDADDCSSTDDNTKKTQ